MNGSLKHVHFLIVYSKLTSFAHQANAIYLTVRRKNLWGPAEIWTRIAGFRVQSANHYTTGPMYPSLSLSLNLRLGSRLLVRTPVSVAFRKLWRHDTYCPWQAKEKCCQWRDRDYTASAVTRIRTWVVSATTRSTNHYTITAIQATVHSRI